MTQSKIFRTSPVQLSEQVYSGGEKLSNKIQLMKVGKFYHEWGEEFDITKEDFASMVKNFDEGVRKIDLMIDYSHESWGPAAAWIKSLSLMDNGNELWAEVEWTKSGEEKVKSKEYRYISGDFHPNYMDNETGTRHGATLFGAALTNRPVLKGMKPTTLSEENNLNKEENMTEAELKKANEEQAKKLSEQDAELAKLRKENEERKLSEEKLKRDAEAQKAEDAKNKLLSEKKEKFDKKLSEGLVVEAQREAYMKDDMEEFMAKAVKVQTQTLGENGGKGGEDNTSKNAQEKVLKLAQDRAKKDSVQLSEAIGLVLSENEELNKEYIKETTPHRA